MKPDEPGIGVVILAAGCSRRMGSPKQLLPYGDKNLLQHTIDEVTQLEAQPKVLVLGAHVAHIKAEISPGAVRVVENDHWQEGIASSIRAGLSSCLAMDPSLSCLLFVISDQPYLTAGHMSRLCKVSRDGKKIVASRYAGGVGVPVVFPRKYFSELTKLSGDQGAKKLLKQFNEAVSAIDFPNGDLDIDTPEDYARWRALNDQTKS